MTPSGQVVDSVVWSEEGMTDLLGWSFRDGVGSRPAGGGWMPTATGIGGPTWAGSRLAGWPRRLSGTARRAPRRSLVAVLAVEDLQQVLQRDLEPADRA